MRLIGFFVAAAALAVSVPAFAGEAKCLWNALSVSTQEAMIARAEAGSTDVIGKLSPSESRSVAIDCFLTKATLAPAGSALVAYAEEQAEIAKADRTIFSASQELPAVWNALSPEERAAFRSVAYQLISDPSNVTDRHSRYDALRRELANKDLTVKTGAQVDTHGLQMYFVWRAERENLEAKF